MVPGKPRSIKLVRNSGTTEKNQCTFTSLNGKTFSLTIGLYENYVTVIPAMPVPVATRSKA